LKGGGESLTREALIVAASEIMVKGRLRPRLLRLLAKNIAEIAGDRRPKIYLLQGRVIVEPGSAGGLEELARMISLTPGVRWVRIGYVLPRDYEMLQSLSETLAREAGVKTIAVKALRSDKSYPKKSQDIMAELGARICRACGARVDLENPEMTFWVSVQRDSFLLSTRRFEGVGGLPVGSSGKVLALLSGGIDSPVAAWLAMKRGCIVDMLHIYALPRPEDVLTSKVREIFLRLKNFSQPSKLYLASYHHFLQASLTANPRLELALFRRFMLKLAEVVAVETKAKAIVTGDSLAQVASQTLESMHSASYGLKLQVLRPLIGLDKEEITNLSKRLNLFELSISDYKDCCSIISKHPITHPRLENVLAEWERTRLDDAVERTLQEIYVFDGSRLSLWKDISTRSNSLQLE